ncbi:MAG: hypothetical protein VR68_09625 [Peptococcaceae bacterium BRH_c4a]|nr:MAG: hypothetical protein VR68_09625 [Peptococcaceae bacterium BRH_c4a]
MSRIRVMHVIRPSAGGIKNHLLTLIEHSDQKKFEHMVVCPAGEMAKAFTGAGITTYEIPLRGEISPAFELSAIKMLVWLFRTNRVDISHCHGSKAGLVGRLAARLAGVPAVVMTVHNSILHDHFPPWKKLMYSQFEGFLAGFTHRIITVSQALGCEIISRERISPEKVVTIYNGISPEQFCLGADREYLQKTTGIPAGVRIVGTVARLAPQKGVINFIRAAAELSAGSHGLAFLVVGEGPLRAILEREAGARKLTGKLFFAGDRQDVRKIVPCLDVFVLASLTEGLPLTVLEAMACRRPVVASRVGGIPEIITDGVSGLLVDPGDVTALVSAVRRLLNDEGMSRRMGNEGHNRVMQLFTARKMARDTEEIYAQLICGTFGDKQCALEGGN